jgi:hypothetical protein
MLFQSGSWYVLKPHGVSMHTDQRIVAPIGFISGLAPYLKALTLVSGLLVVWVGLCAI